MYTWNDGTYLMHHGIKGQKWGIRRFQNPDGSYTQEGKKRRGYTSTSLRAYISKKRNEKVDKSFKEWNKNADFKADAIEKGKKANIAKMEWERDKQNRDKKRAYKDAEKDYKKALSKNTTYRKGSVKEEVGKDLSRKYLSEAKKIEKQLKNDPENMELQRRYSSLMSKYDIERASARRAQSVAAKRSNRIASIKRAATITIKSAAAMAAISSGLYVVNKYVLKQPLNINSEDVMEFIRKGRKVASYIYF